MRCSPLWLFALLACGGGQSAQPTPKPTPAPAPAPEPPPAPAPEAAPQPQKAFADMTPEERKSYLMELGEEVYKTGGSGGVACVTCHMENGQGTPGAFPPLVGSKDLMGDCKNHAGLIVKGLTGEIEVGGQKYNSVMPPQPTLTDDEIAAVITYERNSWGNDYGDCTPDDVKAAR